jgi:SAM-dependent methyltransferase
LKEFAKALPQHLLDIEDKKRSNIFAWRGQFSPQLVECLLDAYCPPGSVVLDPFVGSGTVLYEAAVLSLPALGFEINPSAWSFSKVYEFANIPRDEGKFIVRELRARIEDEFPIVLFADQTISREVIEEKVIRIGASISDEAKILCNALVVLLDIHNNRLTNDLVQSKFTALAELVQQLPYSNKTIKAGLQDARALPLEQESVDFVITSPPYINVFNYHQNYRRSAEVLGWDLLRVARSEIGSNRANRGNRFYTVVQYCIDMTKVIQELARVLRPSARAVFIVGYESKVLGTSFYNADIIEQIATKSGVFSVVLRQKRVFMNRFGEAIREDILNLVRKSAIADETLPCRIGRAVAHASLSDALSRVPESNKDLLLDAISQVHTLTGTPIFSSVNYTHYQTRDFVMMVKEDKENPMTTTVPELPTPHLDKLTALLQNARLPSADKPRVEEAIKRYHEWIRELERVKQGQKNAVEKLVEATNRYKKFIELDLIFDSPENFLYRQKGQLKLDNTILEEFLPQLVFRGVRLHDMTFELGPRNTFAGLSFTSSLANTGAGGKPSLRTKDQDFILGKRLYMMTSFDKEFRDAEAVESHLGYVCVECKTNLDKTMFQEAVATSRDLKIAVPSSLYFLVCEFLDMTPVSITPTHIDDVLIVRKAKRMSSNVRQEYRTAEERREHRQEYMEFEDSAKYYADVFQRMIDKIQAVIDDSAPQTDRVLKQGHF